MADQPREGTMHPRKIAELVARKPVDVEAPEGMIAFWGDWQTPLPPESVCYHHGAVFWTGRPQSLVGSVGEDSVRYAVPIPDEDRRVVEYLLKLPQDQWPPPEDDQFEWVMGGLECASQARVRATYRWSVECGEWYGNATGSLIDKLYCRTHADQEVPQSQVDDGEPILDPHEAARIANKLGPEHVTTRARSAVERPRYVAPENSTWDSGLYEGELGATRLTGNLTGPYKPEPLTVMFDDFDEVP